MSLYSAMYSSVSGLSAQSNAMAAISDNITNVNTIGFKGSNVQFSSMVTQQVSDRTAAAGGVQPTVRNTADVQGLLSPSSVTTDMAVAGDGFFVVNEAANPGLGDQWGYTRAGSFRVNDEGYLVNTGGWYLQAWPTLPDGTVGYYDNTGNVVNINQSVIDSTNLQPVNLNMISGSAAATSEMALKLNLPAGANVTDSFQSDALFYDSLGNSQDLGMQWTKTSVNTWDLDLIPSKDAALVTTKDENGEVTFARGQLVFEGTYTAGVLTELTGASFAVNGTTYTFDNTTPPGGALPTTTIGIQGAASWAEIAEEIARVINDPNGRVHADGNRVYFDTDAANGDIIVNSFNDPNGGLAKYMPTFGVSNTAAAGFTVPQLAAQVDTDGDTIPDAPKPAMVFSGDGTPQNINVDTIEFRWANGANDMTGPDAISLDLGTPGLADGVTQFAGEFQPISVHHNGARFGSISGVSIGEDGLVTALFDNGESRAIYKIPLATFVNPNGLESRSGNAWVETDDSGSYTLRTAGGAGTGKIESNSLEASTVDIGEEFTNMIITQRAYSAAGKIVTTADQMLDELIRLKR